VLVATAAKSVAETVAKHKPTAPAAVPAKKVAAKKTPAKKAAVKKTAAKKPAATTPTTDTASA
jgi:RNA polymerase primary sigma factor